MEETSPWFLSAYSRILCRASEVTGAVPADEEACLGGGACCCCCVGDEFAEGDPPEELDPGEVPCAPKAGEEIAEAGFPGTRNATSAATIGAVAVAVFPHLSRICSVRASAANSLWVKGAL